METGPMFRLLCTACIASFAIDASHAIDDVNFDCTGTLENMKEEKEMPITGTANLMLDGRAVIVIIKPLRNIVVAGTAVKTDDKFIRFSVDNNVRINDKKAKIVLVDRVEGSITIQFGELPDAYMAWLHKCKINRKRPQF
jgi:hypothetical protein